MGASNPKQLLNELLQMNHVDTLPTFFTARVSGTPEHAPQFECTLSLPLIAAIDGSILLGAQRFVGHGWNKKEAEQQAARAAVDFVAEHAPAAVRLPSQLALLAQQKQLQQEAGAAAAAAGGSLGKVMPGAPVLSNGPASGTAGTLRSPASSLSPPQQLLQNDLFGLRSAGLLPPAAVNPGSAGVHPYSSPVQGAAQALGLGQAAAQLPQPAGPGPAAAPAAAGSEQGVERYRTPSLPPTLVLEDGVDEQDLEEVAPASAAGGQGGTGGARGSPAGGGPAGMGASMAGMGTSPMDHDGPVHVPAAAGSPLLHPNEGFFFLNGPAPTPAVPTPPPTPATVAGVPTPAATPAAVPAVAPAIGPPPSPLPRGAAAVAPAAVTLSGAAIPMSAPASAPLAGTASMATPPAAAPFSTPAMQPSAPAPAGNGGLSLDAMSDSAIDRMEAAQLRQQLRQALQTIREMKAGMRNIQLAASLYA